MPDPFSAQISSLEIVHDEFNVAVQDAVKDLEYFIEERDNAELLQSCIDRIKQVDGTLRLIQLNGAVLLAQEMVRLANDIPVGADKNKDEALGILSESLLILARYVEYVLQQRAVLPPLLLPYVNNIRAVLKDSPLSESYFFTADLEGSVSLVDEAVDLPQEDPAKLVARLRHMYQVGLLNLIHDKPQTHSLDIMRRSMERLAKISGNRAMATLWCLAEAVIGCMSENKMVTNRSRKLLFAAVDRQIKRVIKSGWRELENEPPKGIVKDLLYLLGISGDKSDHVTSLCKAFDMPEIGITDAVLVAQSNKLAGPSVNTLASVTSILHEELHHAKEILDIASRTDGAGEQSFGELLTALVKISDTLLVVGLSGPSESLRNQASHVESWINEAIVPADDNFVDIADALLYAESSLSGLENNAALESSASEPGAAAQREMIASNQLAEAEMLVIREAQAGIALVKRALNSYAEARFDKVHIANVNTSLNGVRGGLVVLGLDRASVICESCISFVEKSLLKNDDIGAIQHMLETFADAIISIEYYLDEIAVNKDTDDKILDIADESLIALGYSTAA